MADVRWVLLLFTVASGLSIRASHRRRQRERDLKLERAEAFQAAAWTADEEAVEGERPQHAQRLSRRFGRCSVTDGGYDGWSGASRVVH